jgi:hypothetical protein
MLATGLLAISLLATGLLDVGMLATCLLAISLLAVGLLITVTLRRPVSSPGRFDVSFLMGL